MLCPYRASKECVLFFHLGSAGALDTWVVSSQNSEGKISSTLVSEEGAKHRKRQALNWPPKCIVTLKLEILLVPLIIL